MFTQTSNQSKRSLSLDALRGFALFGVLVTNIFIFNNYSGDFNSYLSSYADTLNQNIGSVIQYFFRGRFYPIFSFLFGLGMVMLFLRQSSPEAGIKLLLRRLIILLVVGVLHYILIWDGDILIRYSLAGFFALAFISLPKNFILVTAIFVYSIHSYYSLHTSSIPTLADLTSESIVHSNYLQQVLYRIKGLPKSYGTVESFFYSLKVLSFVMLGIYFRKSFSLHSNRKFNWLIPLLILVLIRLATAAISFLSPDSESNFLLSLINYIINPAIYVIGFLLLASSGVFKQVLTILSDAGRMSLTNYLLQSLVLSFIFYGYGLNQYQEWAPWQLISFAILFFIVQGYVSHMWLKHHKQGPVEKLWRYLTYEQAKRTAQLK